MDLGLRGRCAIVTGASRGIGSATAKLLADEGADVVIAARGAESLEEAAHRIGPRAVAVQADVHDRGSSERLRDAALEHFGRIDIVVNNAGGGGGPLTTFVEDEWLHVFELNVTSAVRLTTACVPAMREHGWGRVVNVASTMARHCDPRFGSYGAAKASLLHVTRNLSLAYSQYGILVNCVLPGLTRTDGVLAGYAGAAAALGRDEADIERRMMQRQPIAMGRTGEPGEVASVIAFLCSEQASWVTGAEVPVDGGTLTDI